MQTENPNTIRLAPLAGLQIALVDDEPGIVRALTLILSTVKCRVAAFPSAEEAFLALRNDTAIELIISDLRMPNGSGIDLFERLRAAGDMRPFLLMSGHATAHEVRAAKEAGIAGFLPKPFTPPALAEEVARVMRDVRGEAIRKSV
jgi:two-component system response regulator GlrR